VVRLPAGCDQLSAVVADTHALVWYLADPPRLSRPAAEALRQAAAAGIYSSAVTVVEPVYLVEKARLPETLLARVMEEVRTPGATLRVVPVDLEVVDALRSIPRAEVPDLPDRVIAATALTLGLPLVSRDRQIRASAVETVW